MSAAELPPAVEDNLGSLLGLVRSRLVGELEHELEQAGFALRHTQYLVLKHLAQDGASSPCQLAADLGYDPGAMTRMLDGLERKGYVRRQPSTKDRRSVRIAPTEAGKALWTQMHRCGERVLGRAFARLTPTEQDTLKTLLVRIAEALDNSAKGNCQE